MILTTKSKRRRTTTSKPKLDDDIREVYLQDWINAPK